MIYIYIYCLEQHVWCKLLYHKPVKSICRCALGGLRNILLNNLVQFYKARMFEDACSSWISDYKVNCMRQFTHVDCLRRFDWENLPALSFWRQLIRNKFIRQIGQKKVNAININITRLTHNRQDLQLVVLCILYNLNTKPKYRQNNQR